MNCVMRGVFGLAAACGVAATAQAVNINLSGSLGNGNWHTPNVPLAHGGTLAPITVFQSVPGVGDLSCDVYTDNSGTTTLGNSVFSLKITNLVFQAYASSPTTQTSVKLKVEENFVIPFPFSTQAAVLAMDGVMSSTGGCTVFGSAQFESPIGTSGGTPLPGLSYNGGSAGPDFFNVTPSFVTVSPPFAGAGHNILYLQIQLELFINGNGFVNMPSSFTASSESVPAPGPLGLAVMAGLALSRRRRNATGGRHTTTSVRLAAAVACCAAVGGHALAAPPVQPGYDMDVLSGGPQSPPPISVTNGQPTWVAFTLSNGFSTTPGLSTTTGLPLTAVTFMDITVQQTSAYNVDWNFGLYNSFGVLVASNTVASLTRGPSGGGGSYAELSFGLQTARAAVLPSGPQGTPGAPLANQNNQFPLPPHLQPDIYYLAIVAGPTATFGNNFTASSSFPGAVTALITIDSDNRGKCPLNPCDMNSDGAVDNDDFVLFAASYQAMLSLTGDFDGDGFVDDADYVHFLGCFSNLFSGC